MAQTSLHSWLQQASYQLANSGCSNHRQEAEYLLAQALNKPKAFLYSHPETLLSPAQTQQLNNWLTARLAGQPLAWILGSWEFWGLELQVSPATLIPRADTELLVELALDLHLPDQARVLDLGTGTGALALALKHERPNWLLTASDVQPAALELAHTNAKRLNLDIDLVLSDWWHNLPQHTYDLIVSNPPYIHPDDPHLQQGDVRFEPATALVGGADGLDAYRQILAPIQQRLNPRGYLLVEQGYQQATAVAQLFQLAGLTEVQTFTDYGQQPRVTLGRLAF